MARTSRRRDAAVNGDCNHKTGDLLYNVLYRVGAYVRLSCDDTKKRGDSLETQRNIIENFVSSEPGMQIMEVYTDNNATGTNFIRPGFQRMLTDAQSGKINCIIVKDLTRFGRNAIDSGYYIEKVLPALGVRFIAVTDSFDSLNDNGGLLLPIKNIISESYALDIGRKCRAVQRQNMKDGRFVGRLAPYGYMKSPEDCHKLIPDDETAPIVRRMFEWADEGAGGNEIARRLTAEGIPSPSHRNHSKGYNTSETLLGTVYWKSRTVKDILADRVYVGDMAQGKTKKVNNKQVNIDPSEWVCVENTHEPLVSRDVFERVQAQRLEIYERAKTIQQNTTAYSANVLKGKVFCAHCGYPCHRNKQSNHDYYWFRCESQWKYGKDTCFQVSVKESDITESILKTLQENKKMLQKLGSDTTPQYDCDADSAELLAINRKLSDNGRFLKSLYENLAGGLITADEYTQMKADYQAKIAALSNRADEIRIKQREAEARKTGDEEISGAAKAALRDGRLTAQIVDSLVESVYINRDKSFHINYRGGVLP